MSKVKVIAVVLFLVFCLSPVVADVEFGLIAGFGFTTGISFSDELDTASGFGDLSYLAGLVSIFDLWESWAFAPELGVQVVSFSYTDNSESIPITVSQTQVYSMLNLLARYKRSFSENTESYSEFGLSVLYAISGEVELRGNLAGSVDAVVSESISYGSEEESDKPVSSGLYSWSWFYFLST